MLADPQTADTPPDAFPSPRTKPFQPPAEYTRDQRLPGLRRVKLWDGKEAWLVTRYDDFRAVLRDNRFSADTRHPNFPDPSPGMKVARGNYRAFVSMDEPEHSKHRRMLTAEFSRNRILALKPQIEAIVDELLDNFLRSRSSGDFYAEVALPLPSRIICMMLGIPYDAHSFFQKRAEVMISTESTIDEVVQASRELIDEYLGRLLDEKAVSPGNDVLSRLVCGPLKDGDLSRGELLAIARLLLVAGHDSTANTSAMSLVTLLLHPQQLEELKNAPELMPNAIEELLRYLDPAHGGRRRVALADVTISGQLIRAGEAVVAHNPTADRDERFFPDPDRFDIHRKARQHVAFGDGIHQCLGQSLARIELGLLLKAVLRRAPEVRLAVPVEELEFLDRRVVYGIKAVPIAW